MKRLPILRTQKARLRRNVIDALLTDGYSMLIYGTTNTGKTTILKRIISRVKTLGVQPVVIGSSFLNCNMLNAKTLRRYLYHLNSISDTSENPEKEYIHVKRGRKLIIIDGFTNIPGQHFLELDLLESFLSVNPKLTLGGSQLVLAGDILHQGHAGGSDCKETEDLVNTYLADANISNGSEINQDYSTSYSETQDDIYDMSPELYNLETIHKTPLSIYEEVVLAPETAIVEEKNDITCVNSYHSNKVLRQKNSFIYERGEAVYKDESDEGRVSIRKNSINNIFCTTFWSSLFKDKEKNGLGIIPIKLELKDYGPGLRFNQVMRDLAYGNYTKRVSDFFRSKKLIIPEPGLINHSYFIKKGYTVLTKDSRHATTINNRYLNHLDKEKLYYSLSNGVILPEFLFEDLKDEPQKIIEKIIKQNNDDGYMQPYQNSWTHRDSDIYEEHEPFDIDKLSEVFSELEGKKIASPQEAELIQEELLKKIQFKGTRKSEPHPLEGLPYYIPICAIIEDSLNTRSALCFSKNTEICIYENAFRNENSEQTQKYVCKVVDFKKISELDIKDEDLKNQPDLLLPIIELENGNTQPFEPSIVRSIYTHTDGDNERTTELFAYNFGFSHLFCLDIGSSYGVKFKSLLVDTTLFQSGGDIYAALTCCSNINRLKIVSPEKAHLKSKNPMGIYENMLPRFTIKELRRILPKGLHPNRRVKGIKKSKKILLKLDRRLCLRRGPRAIQRNKQNTIKKAGRKAHSRHSLSVPVRLKSRTSPSRVLTRKDIHKLKKKLLLKLNT